MRLTSDVLIRFNQGVSDCSFKTVNAMDATRHSESESHAHHKSSIVSSDAVAVKIEGASQSILDVKGSSGSVDLDALLEEDFDGILSTSQHATKLDETTDAQGGVEPIETCEIGRTQARGLLESLLKRFKGARVHTSQMAGYSQDISEWFTNTLG